MKNKGIYDYLMRGREERHISFHMPGHKGQALYEDYGYGPFLRRIMDCDITEIPGADNLFQPEGIIAETMEKYRRHYGVRKSYLLVNGSSGGILAAVLSAAGGCGGRSAGGRSAGGRSAGGRSVVSDKLVMARNCHKSVFNALSLGGLCPVYAKPEIVGEYGILGAVTAEEVARCLDENPEAAAVILPSPNYYGICSDIEAIAKAAHDRGKLLIVDQAHGAHLNLLYKSQMSSQSSPRAERGESSFACSFEIPRPAEMQGADMVINSIHKTLASWTQTAVLNVCSEVVDLARLEDMLQAVESSSPSYPLMASLDISADLVDEHGCELAGRWLNGLRRFYDRAEELCRIRIVRTPDLDVTKINIDVSALGMDGLEAEAFLMVRSIIPELVTGHIVMCMSGIGNTPDDFDALFEALQSMEAECGVCFGGTAGFGSDGDSGGQRASEGRTDFVRDGDLKHAKDVQVKSLTFAGIPQSTELVRIEAAAGRVCAKSIIPYPPGIPIACPGEVLDGDVTAYVCRLRSRGEKVIGVREGGLVEVGVCPAP